MTNNIFFNMLILSIAKIYYENRSEKKLKKIIIVLRLFWYEFTEIPSQCK